ncbi:NADH-quinone oxidoreductase subunit A [Olivibacter sp. XZL3]|uniref:NADH-quinone oxidoreductase subunit A n=1 Tax=Olivibacter sp. XZL3 TaxID=1735116 RepID=UPI00106495F0|nr:NADH-quinone oxidoreductase subunit A [Olivibacter sp. XZL3]
MEDGSQITEFGKVFVYLLVGTLLVIFTLLLGKLLSPRKPTAAKLSTYECGEVAQGSSWIQFNARFYVVALVFLLFDVEMVFIFPWTTVFGSTALINADERWGWYTLAEMFIFIGILVVGLFYVWKKGDLEWIKPNPIRPALTSTVPVEVYEDINNAHYTVKPFERNNTQGESKQRAKPNVAGRPAFKPKFVKKDL